MSAPDVEVSIRLPLPLDIVTTLGDVLNVAYPGTMLRTDGPQGFLTLVVPELSRRPKAGKRAIRAAVTHEDDLEQQGEVVNIGEKDGQFTVDMTTPEEARHMLAHLASIMLADPAAVNYVEQQANHPDVGSFFVIACRSQGQTPHELRLVAEKKLEQATSALNVALAYAEGRLDATSDTAFDELAGCRTTLESLNPDA